MKGQWFLISAVIATSIFFGLSLLFKDYFVVDSSYQAGINNDYHFYSIINQFDRIVNNTVTDGDCTNLTAALSEFRAVTEKELAAKGLFVLLEYSVTSPCSSQNIVPVDLIVASENQVIYNFSSYSDPSEVIGAA